MDKATLVNRENDALNEVARVFRMNGIAVTGIYLIQLTAESGYSERVVRLVTDRKLPNAQRDMIHKLVELRRNGKLPEVDGASRFDIVSADDAEASRIIDYARQYGSLPVLIDDTMWKGLFIEYAIVAELPQPAAALA